MRKSIKSLFRTVASVLSRNRPSRFEDALFETADPFVVVTQAVRVHLQGIADCPSNVMAQLFKAQFEAAAEVLKAALQSGQPSVRLDQLIAHPAQLIVHLRQAIVDTGQAIVDTGQAIVDTGQPFVDTGQPFVDTGQPFVDTGEPFVDTGEPIVDTAQSFVRPGHLLVGVHDHFV